MSHSPRSLLGVALLAFLCLSPAVRAQVDYGAIRSGVAGCPELAADPTVGALGAALCRPVDRTTLDLPIRATSKFFEVRAGVWSTVNRQSLLHIARGSPVLAPSTPPYLNGLIRDGFVLSASQDALQVSLLAQAADPATPPATAVQLIAQANALVAGTFDAFRPTLLAARVDRDRLADLRTGLLRVPGAVDVITPFDAGLIGSLSGVASLGTSLPPGTDADGDPLYNAQDVLAAVYPIFVGPDGSLSTTDDLPYVGTNPTAQAAGYSLSPPISGTVEDRFDRAQAGLALFTATAKRTVPSSTGPGGFKTVEIYGVYNPTFLVRTGCGPTGLGGTFDASTGTCTGAGGVDLTADARVTGCALRSRPASGYLGVGYNADGDCIELNTVSELSSTVQFDVLPMFADTSLRPASAGLEPADLTDLMLRFFGSSGLPARPRSPSSNVVFPSAAASFSRRVDLTTGAPTGPAAGAQCRVRVDGGSVPVGPNGIAGDGDDAIPSAGGCLLWSAPAGSAPQSLAPATSVAANAAANQGLFHSLCTLSYDADAGRCPWDALNDPRTLGFATSLLSGLGAVGGVVLEGVDTIRSADDGVLRRQSFAVFATMFDAISPAVPNPASEAHQDLGLVLEPEQHALLGCGVSFASPCSARQAQTWAAAPAIASAIRAQYGGIDALNSSASVLVQEFAAVKALKADSLVGTVATEPNDIAYLPGMNFSRDGTLGTHPAPPQDSGSIPVENGVYLGLTPAQVIALGPSGRASYQHGGANKVQADGWVEPMAWAVDPGPLAAFGAVVFEVDPNDPFAGPGNSFVAGGEYCGRWMLSDPSNTETPFNQTCTALEKMSANLERLIIARSVVGQDRVFDPPETVAELVAMLDGNPANDANGDPVAGPDGIFARNQRVFSATEMDFEVVRGLDGNALGLVEIAVAPADPAAALAFLLAYDPAASCTSRPFCALEVNDVLSGPGDAQSPDPLLLALPIGTEAEVIVGGVPAGLTKVNLARLSLQDRHGLNRLFAGESVLVGGQSLRLNLAQRRALLGVRGSQNQRGLDLDGDGTTDLDRDRDGVYDGADDFTQGPVSDDEILCGSGLPGDLLQDGIQLEPWNQANAPGSAAFAAALPNGLAPRSPVFCRGLNRILSVMGPSSAQSDAFLWHGGTLATSPDQDVDGWPDALDACPTRSDPTQQDSDADGVGDACDNCVARANPRVASNFLTTNPWATLTGGQRDDDADGYGNACDGKFPGVPGTVVGSADLLQFRASSGKARTVDTCGTLGTRPCALYDLDETGLVLGTGDLARLRQLAGKTAGPRCPTCPLACSAGPQGSCP